MDRSEARALILAHSEPTPDGCWHWAGSSSGGRGRVWIDGQGVYAYRLAYEAWREPIPAGLVACHSCDNPLCVNPDPIFIGTQRDNIRDAVTKGRMRFPAVRTGLAHHGVTTPPEVIAEQVARYQRGEATQTEIAVEFGVAQSTVGRWVRRESRPDVDAPAIRRGKGRVAPSRIKPCGTRAGWFRHRAAGEPACDPCVEANRAYMRAYKLSRSGEDT